MRLLVTGGGGFVGSHVVEYYAKRGEEVIALDNLSRARILGSGEKNARYNWEHLGRYDNVERAEGDIRDGGLLQRLAGDVDAIIHTAGQVAVTTSLKDPRTDMEINLLGTFNVLEAARLSKSNPAVLFCSTNKVYGDNVNKIPVEELETRYAFAHGHANGVPESLSTDLCEHTPYGCSKLAADIYVQDYGKRHEVDTAVFRMSCIYGTRQFGTEDQGWVAHFVIATLTGRPLTIFGDGKQVRDLLYVEDLVRAYDAFLGKRERYAGEVYNTGGGVKNTTSLLELLDLLEAETGMRSELCFSDWRPSDQKVYISDITKAKKELGWEPKIGPRDGIKRMVSWVGENKRLF
ncbi:MAG: NAD-dependent epimerase/dehydratase family protein [Candidatus Hydrothermarchaeota archaeon]